MDAKSHRPAQVAARNSLSRAFVYEEIKAGRLRARKAGTVTLITNEDEQAWLDSMPGPEAMPVLAMNKRNVE